MTSKFINVALFLLICLLALTACQPNGIKRDVEEYAQRLAKVLETPPPRLTLNFYLRYPPKTALNTDISQTNISLTEFYNLENCPANPLIAQRNTTLGKVHSPSQRYLYEVNLITALQQCLEKASPKQQAVISEWLQHKRQQLPQAWRNLIQWSTETKQFLSTNHPLTASDKQSLTNSNKQALTYLLNLQTQPTGDATQLEHHLKTLKQHPLLGKTWYTQGAIAQGLQQLNPWLAEQLAKHRCQRQKIDYLNNVFQLFFINKIQASANQINQQQYAFSELTARIVNNPTLSPTFKDLFTRHHQQHNQLKKHIKQHIQIWQDMLSRCKLAHFADK